MCFPLTFPRHKPDEFLVHDVFTPAIVVSRVDILDLSLFDQVLVVDAVGGRGHVAQEHGRVGAGDTFSFV